MSLAQLSDWCTDRFGARPVTNNPKPRPYDVPWLVMDCAQAKRVWDWEVGTPLLDVLDEIGRGVSGGMLS